MTVSFRFTRLLLASAGLMAFRSFAQDVTVSDPIWALTDPAPDQMPKRGNLRPSYPEEKKTAPEPGYVLIFRDVATDEKSQPLHSVASDPSFQRAVETEFVDWDMSPAKRNGKPVSGEFWLAALFNPKSAALKGPDATARLLAVAPVIYPQPKDTKAPPTVVPMHLKLDASGSITESVPEAGTEPTLVNAIQESFKKWRFAPARKNGQSVPSELVMPVAWQPATREEMSAFTPPKILERGPTTYPAAMRSTRLSGSVTVRFDVDVDGTVKNPVIARSLNAGFDDAALDGLRQWKFAPAHRDGQPVKAGMNATLQFSVYASNSSSAPAEATATANRPDMSKLPPELRYDTPAKIHGTVMPVYPYALQRDQVTGSASVVLGIDEQGHVVETKVLAASRPEFGLAVVAAAESASFDPALRATKGVPSVQRFSQEFSAAKPADRDPNDLLSLEKKHPEKIIAANKLDAPLHPISRALPVFPVSLLGKVETGRATVQILIDSDGHVRLPRVISATEEAFGYSAVQAVTAWVFDPPKVGGRAAITRVQVPIDFSGPPLAATDSAAAKVPAVALEK